MVAYAQVDKNAAIEINNTRDELERIGFIFEPPIYEIGAKHAEKTEQGFLRVQNEFEKKPIAEEALHTLIQRIRAEQREDVKVSLKDAKINDGIFFCQDKPFFFEKNGFSKAMQVMGKYLNKSGYPMNGISQFLSTAPMTVREKAFNELVKYLKTDSEAIFRTRYAHNVYGVVSDKYQKVDIDHVAQSLLDVFDFPNSRAEIIYDGYRASIKILWHNYHDISRSGAGDVFRFGVEVTTSDDATESIKVNLVAWINQCLNYIIVDNNVVNIKTIRHIGYNVKSSFKLAMNEAKKKSSDIINRWNQAAVERIIKSEDDVRTIFTKLIDKGYGKVAGMSKKGLVEMYVKAWYNNPGYTKANIINAMTRAAHTSRWSSPWTQREIEKEAGRLLYVNVRSVI